MKNEFKLYENVKMGAKVFFQFETIPKEKSQNGLGVVKFPSTKNILNITEL